MSEKPISPLRRRMIEDMTVRAFVEKMRNDYMARQDVHSLPRTFAGDSDSGGSSPLPAAPDTDWRACAEHQWIGCGAALLLHRDA